MCEESVVVSGLLMGLNAVDYNVLMRGEEFDKSVRGCQHPVLEWLHVGVATCRLGCWTSVSICVMEIT